MNVKKLSEEEKKFVVEVINMLGENHPAATPENLGYFESAYVKELMLKAQKNLKEPYRTMAREIAAREN